jgi:hypothetical protein
MNSGHRDVIAIASEPQIGRKTQQFTIRKRL